MRFRTLVSAAACAAGARPFTLPSDGQTIASALALATASFTDSGVPEPALSAEHLLTRCAGFGSSRAALSIHKQEHLDDGARVAFETMCTERLARRPVQYILGDWDFLDLTLTMRAPVLIPRPETEELVELVLEAHGHARGGDSGATSFLDVGCGSGAIGLALLHRLPEARCVAIDVSAAAAELSAHNAELCGLADRYRVELVDGGVAACAFDVRFDVIVANLPYIPRSDMETLEPEVAWYEDVGALCGGEDGLDIVRETLAAAPRLLRSDGPRTIWLEVDPTHPALIDCMLRKQQSELSMEMVREIADASGRPRFCEIRWRGP